MRSSQKRREQFHLEVLSELVVLPGAEVDHGYDSPDFLFEDESVVTGIEHTELKLSMVAKLKGLQRKIVQNVQILAEEHDIPPIEVKVNFHDSYYQYPQKGRATSIALFESVKESIDRIEKEQNGTSIKIPIPDPFVGISPIHVKSGRYDGEPWLPQHRWGLFEIGWEARQFDDDLRDAIIRKNKKYPDYRQRCDLCWLLIVVDRYLADALSSRWWKTRISCLKNRSEVTSTVLYYSKL